MAQVRKFNTGGKTFKLAGYTFNTNNKEDMDMLTSLTSDSKYGGIAQSILDNVNDSNYANSLNAYRTSDGRVVMEGELQKIKDAHMSSGTQKALSRKNNVFWNTVKRQSGKEWANNMDSFLSEISRRKSTPTSTETETPSKIKVKGVHDLGGRWTYNEQGWDEADVNNEAMLNRIDVLEKYVKASEEDRKNKYDVSELNADQLNAFIKMYEKDNELFNKYRPLFAKDQKRLDDNNDFYSTFKWFGFNNGVSDDAYAKKVAEDKTKKTYTNANWDYDKWKDYGVVNEDGSLELNKDVLGNYSTGNYMFNDYWANSAMNPGEEWLRGYTKIGNRLYKTSDAEKEGTALYNYLRKRGGFYDLNQVGDYAGSNSIINWLWDTPYYQNVDKTNIGNFFEGNYQYDPTNLRTSNTTWNGGTLNEGDQIVQYLNMNDDSSNYLGLRTPLYGIIDKAGNWVKNGLSRDSFTNLFDGGTKEVMEAQQLLSRQRVSNNPKSPYYNRYKETVGDESNPLFTFYTNPETGEITMVPGELLTNKTIGEDVGIKNIDASVKELFQNEKIINLIKTNPRFQKKLQNTIMSLTGSDWQDLFKGNFNTAQELMEFGLTEKEANLIINAFYNKGSNAKDGDPAYKRKSDYLEYIPSNKIGGILRAQPGAVLNAGLKQSNSNIDTLDSKGESKEVVKHTEVGTPGNQILSRADIAELISAGADVVGTITGLFGPVGDVAGTAIGLGASATQLGADISRDGFQLKDLGRFALNAGLDVVGLVPFLGDASRVAKVANTVKKVSRIASPVFIGMGLTAAAGSIDKIMKGEKLTVTDWTNLAAGFQAITNAGVLGKQRFNKAKVDSLASKMSSDVKMLDYKAKIDKTEVNITAKEFADNINGKSRDEVTKFLIQKAKAAGVADNKMPKDIIEHFGLKSSGVGTGKWSIKWGKVSDPNLPKVEPERSTFKSFFSRIDKNLDAAAADGRLQKAIDHYSSPTQEISNGLSRAFASEAVARDLNVNVTPSGFRYSRLNQLPVNREGGVLKGKNGLWDFTTNLLKENPVDLTKKPEPSNFLNLNEDGGFTTNLVDKAIRNANAKPVSLDEPVTKAAQFTTNYAKDHNGKHAQEWVKDVKLADPASAKPSNNNFDWNYALKEGLGLVNTLSAISDAKKFREQSNKKADIFASGQPAVWSGRGRARFQTLTGNQTNQEIAANNTAANMFKTSDSALNLAGRLGITQTNAALRNQGNRLLSQEYSNALKQYDAIQREDDKLAFETGNRARQYAAQAGMMRVAGDTEYTTNLGAIRDKYFNKLQSDINRFGLMDVAKQNKIDQLNLMKNQPGVTADQIKQIDTQIATINSPEYSNILRRQAMYGTASAKKGTKLRSVSEQMLLDNNKLVAKAIEKLNDNTTKLILKALS